MQNNYKFKIKKKSYSVQLPMSIINRIRLIKKLKKGSIDIGYEILKLITPLIEKLEKEMKLDKNSWKHVKKCPKCDSYLIIRNGSKGKFYGCYNYPKCKHTDKIYLQDNDKK